MFQFILLSLFISFTTDAASRNVSRSKTLTPAQKAPKPSSSTLPRRIDYAALRLAACPGIHVLEKPFLTIEQEGAKGRPVLEVENDRQRKYLAKITEVVMPYSSYFMDALSTIAAIIVDTDPTAAGQAGAISAKLLYAFVGGDPEDVRRAGEDITNFLKKHKNPLLQARAEQVQKAMAAFQNLSTLSFTRTGALFTQLAKHKKAVSSKNFESNLIAPLTYYFSQLTKVLSMQPEALANTLANFAKNREHAPADAQILLQTITALIASFATMDLDTLYFYNAFDISKQEAAQMEGYSMQVLSENMPYIVHDTVRLDQKLIA